MNTFLRILVGSLATVGAGAVFYFGGIKADQTYSAFVAATEQSGYDICKKSEVDKLTEQIDRLKEANEINAAELKAKGQQDHEALLRLVKAVQARDPEMLGTTAGSIVTFQEHGFCIDGCYSQNPIIYIFSYDDATGAIKDMTRVK